MKKAVGDCLVCDLVLCRGLIMHYEAHASHGSVVLAPDKKLLAWSLGEFKIVSFCLLKT